MIRQVKKPGWRHRSFPSRRRSSTLAIDDLPEVRHPRGNWRRSPASRCPAVGPQADVSDSGHAAVRQLDYVGHQAPFVTPATRHQAAASNGAGPARGGHARPETCHACRTRSMHRTYKFPLAASARISLSSDRSDTARRRRSFSVGAGQILDLPLRSCSSAPVRLPSVSALHFREALGTRVSNASRRRFASWHRCPTLVGNVGSALPSICLDQRVQFRVAVVSNLELGDADCCQIFDEGVLRHLLGVCLRGTASDCPARRKHDYRQRDGTSDSPPCERLNLIYFHLYFHSGEKKPQPENVSQARVTRSNCDNL